MRVTVFHKADREGTSFDRMCVVEAPCTDVMDALEYAYRWTNNINGSWSRSGNADSNENVTEIAPLVDGMGHRSTSMFDRMAIEGAWYEVAGFGFDKMFSDDDLAEIGEKIIEQAQAKAKKQTKKELVAEMIERVGLEDRKTLINLIVNTLNVTKANAGVYVYNFKKARGL
jgi:hypothetical protein